MPRKGRTLELLVAKLEELTSQISGNVEIKSPDSILDIFTDEPREVDISLRAKVGTHEVLIILECRDHSRKQGTQWIEQLATKRDSIRASKAIAVSSSGYSKPAILKAQFLNIELRTVDKVSFNDIASWFKAPSLKNIKRHSDIIHVEFDPKLNISQIDLDAKVFWFPETNRNLSLKEIATIIRDNDSRFFDRLDPASPANPPIFKLIRINVFEEPVYMILDNESILLREIILEVKLWTETSDIKPSNLSQYSEKGKPISQSLSFEIPVNGSIVRLDTHHITDSGLTHFTTQFISPDTDS